MSSSQSSNDMILLLQGIANLSDEKLEFVTLPHPKFQTPTVYIMNRDTFLELQTSQFRKFGSWFVNQRVSSNGSISFGTICDPKFLVLPFIEKAGSKFSPLDQIIPIVEGCTRIPLNNSKNWGLEKICDVKDLGDMVLYRYNSQMTLEWLKKKVECVSQVLAHSRFQKEKLNNTAIVTSFNMTCQSTSSCNSVVSGATKEGFLIIFRIFFNQVFLFNESSFFKQLFLLQRRIQLLHYRL
jgi:Ydr279p protein family (RNase H2 complex component) wHTH domain/Ydr279p protein triple barrel domain